MEEIKSRSADNFQDLAHYIGRLGATRAAVKAVVTAMEQCPSLRQIREIRVIKAPAQKVVTLRPEDVMSPYEMVRAIGEDTASQNILDTRRALHELVERDLPSAGNEDSLRRRMSRRKTIVTRVHAELQIADCFSRRKFDFVGGDKFIGCSKPACYFCYNWLSNHRHRYVLPATHQKIIPGCRGPDQEINDSGEAVLRDMYKRMDLSVGQDIFAFLLQATTEGNVRLGRRFMSTNGSTHAPSSISVALQPRNLVPGVDTVHS